MKVLARKGPPTAWDNEQTRRLLWAPVAAGALVLFLAAAPYRLQMLVTDVYGYGPVLADYGLSLPAFAVYFTVIEVLTATSLLAIASVIAWRRSDNWFALLVATTFAYLGILLPLMDGLLATGPAWQLLIVSLRVLVYTGLFAILCLFPNGRFVPSSSRLYLFAWLIFVLAFPRPIFSTLSDMAIIPDTRTLDDSIVLLGGALWAGIGLLFQIVRYVRFASAEQRRQTRWVVAGLTLLTASSLVNALLLALFPALREEIASNFLYVMSMGTLLLLTGIGLCITVALAILRDRLWGIHILINRTLVYGGLTAVTIGIYVLLVGGAGILLQAQGSAAIAFVATGVVAVLFQPLRMRLQSVVDRLMYGQRDDPVGMLRQLAQRLETVDSAESILPTLVESVGTALKIPYVALSLPERGPNASEAPGTYWKQAAAYGQRTEELRPIALVYQKREIARLFLAPRAPGERFSTEDERLLAMIAQLSATTVRAAQMSVELQRSRRQIVASREEERRRLRRDLHDGLGPVLASVALQADTARDMTESDPEETKVILQSIMAQAQTALADVRRLVYDLRPPALDEMGLVEALRQFAQSLRHQVTVRFQASDLPPLPAAVEVAAYRILHEALNNVVKHAHASHCTVQIAADDRLWLVVEDDGVGITPDASAGVGLHSMKERAAELGGTCAVRRGAAGGTRVEAFLPLPAAEEA